MFCLSWFSDGGTWNKKFAVLERRPSELEAQFHNVETMSADSQAPLTTYKDYPLACAPAVPTHLRQKTIYKMLSPKVFSTEPILVLKPP